MGRFVGNMGFAYAEAYRIGEALGTKALADGSSVFFGALPTSEAITLSLNQRQACARALLDRAKRGFFSAAKYKEFEDFYAFNLFEPRTKTGAVWRGILVVCGGSFDKHTVRAVLNLARSYLDACALPEGTLVDG